VSNVSHEQIEEEIGRRLQEMHQRNWSDAVANTIKALEEETIDGCKGNRLCYAKILANLIVTMNNSVDGWLQWMNFNALDSWTDEEFKEYYGRLKKLVIDWLKLDMEITAKKEGEALKRKKKMLVQRAVEAVEKHKKKSGADPKFYVQ